MRCSRHDRGILKIKVLRMEIFQHEILDIKTLEIEKINYDILEIEMLVDLLQISPIIETHTLFSISA